MADTPHLPIIPFQKVSGFGDSTPRITMVLKKLTLQGYKTFASKTSFLFDEGITAVVGPNGSGKSNIADALRWVLGEQSYSTLRGKRTIDMIFAGSQTRPRAGMAQATLTLDNSDQWLPIDYTEVEISRRAYRSGENEYVLNGQKVRLKDITQLLATSGLSERTYTIIGQGLVDRALSLRADERRALFEEAAGINHYKTRRAETLRRLNETQHNLERVQDILSEIKPRLNSLKRQATRARNYDQISQDLRYLLRIWYGYRWDKARTELRLAREAASKAEAAWQDSRRTLLVKQHNMDDLQQKISRAQQRLRGLQEERENVREKLEDARRETAILNERRDAFHFQLMDIESELPQLEKQHIAAQEQLASATEDLSLSQEQLETHRQQLQHFNKSFEGQQAEIRTWQDTLSLIEKERAAVATRLAQAEGQFNQLQKRLREYELESDNDLEDQISHLTMEQKRQEEDLISARGQIEAIRQQRRGLQTQRKKLVSELEQSRDITNQHQRLLRQQRDQIARLDTKVELLGQLRQTEISVSEDVSLLGSLASLIDIPAEHRRAIEAALSSRMASMAVTDSDSIWRLAAGNNQQALLVASLSDIKPPPAYPTPADSDVIDWANKLVTNQQRAQAFVDLLLGPILLVKGRETVYRLAPTLPAGTLAVSTDGFIAYAGGLVEISGSSETESILSREAAWREAKLGLEKMQLEVKQTEKTVFSRMDDSKSVQERIDHLQNEDRHLGTQENEWIQKTGDLQRNVDRSKQQNTYLRKQKERHVFEITRLHKQIQEQKNRIDDDQEAKRSLELKLAEAKAKLESLPVAEARQQEQSLQRNIAAAETIVAGRLAVVDSRQTTLKQVQQQLSRLKQRQQFLLTQQASLSEDESAVFQQQLQDQRSDLEAVIKPIQVRLIEYQDRLAANQQEAGDLQRQSHEKETSYTQTQVRLTQQESQFETLQERIHTDLGLVALRFDKDQTGATPLPISDVVDQLPSVDKLPVDIEKSIQQYRGQLQRMGGINPDAPAEYEETEARFDFMTQQVEDLHVTEEQLRKVISELDELTSQAFAETVEKVNKVFGITFTQLFGGGSARLVLTDPDDLTISGVDIIARLPNRREQGLGLLSGGERSLTASALIFSLLKVSPTPFCVLDEVDAALDEANIDRFREILRELSLKTQFIVITHNRGTVQVAQTIYGVSMQPDSASQVISIRPEEYVRQEMV